MACGACGRRRRQRAGSRCRRAALLISRCAASAGNSRPCHAPPPRGPTTHSTAAEDSEPSAGGKSNRRPASAKPTGATALIAPSGRRAPEPRVEARARGAYSPRSEDSTRGYGSSPPSGPPRGAPRPLAPPPRIESRAPAPRQRGAALLLGHAGRPACSPKCERRWRTVEVDALVADVEPSRAVSLSCKGRRTKAPGGTSRRPAPAPPARCRRRCRAPVSTSTCGRRPRP